MGISQPILGFYDRPMWDAMSSGKLVVQSCTECETFRYPPGPSCPHCLSAEFEWVEISGHGEIVSNIRFDKTYFEDHPAPYNVVAVRIDEGPILITNLVGPGSDTKGSLIGEKVSLSIVERGERRQHAARLIAGKSHD